MDPGRKMLSYLQEGVQLAGADGWHLGAAIRRGFSKAVLVSNTTSRSKPKRLHQPGPVSL